MGKPCHKEPERLWFLALRVTHHGINQKWQVIRLNFRKVLHQHLGEDT